MDRQIGKFLSQKTVGELGKIGWTAKIGPILDVRVNEGLMGRSIYQDSR
jgi:hypothetical protein